ncbi:TetR/AcrR family transcriptional regulator [Nocardioides sambongensis]|uniref:TetR/AcrR family transcriptional regulator n=1 Tax=Nocardioides sambongensis TaxID=2589074 RepID=UPI0015E83362|nr:TetR/AcrR family transcriptional regulator [Nocardioides sambongensis]
MSGRQRGQGNPKLRAAWFDAAYEILATQGYGGLKLAPLCRRLGVTTGSFYYSFANWPEFTDALLTTWLEQRTRQTVAIVNEYDDPVVRLGMLLEASTALLHRSEAAIRVWAGTDERVAAVQREVDHDRYQVVVEAMAALVGEERADAYATWAMSTLVGSEMLAATHGTEHLGWSLQQIVEAAR